ncbi:MAG TPA: sigma-70 family RNA polymerase sigma factor [Bryobacteraceae bacterium]|nr:sigma-70 family RNA polymerase sigma factor [Bryobacteraceae bacterium]
MGRENPSREVTQLLANWGRGDLHAREELIPLVYNELRGLASSYLRRERSDHTLQATALVHEAYLRLVDQQSVNWENRRHFFGAAAQVMRRILVDHARARIATKRGSGAAKVALTEAVVMCQEQPGQMVVLNEALEKLSALDEQQGRIVELRVFGGLGVEEIAAVLGISTSTVKRDWALAKAWLWREIGNSGAP